MTTKKAKKATDAAAQAAADAKAAAQERQRLVKKAQRDLIDFADKQDERLKRFDILAGLRLRNPYRDLIVELMLRLKPLKYGLITSKQHGRDKVLTLLPERWPHLRIHIWPDGDLHVTSIPYWTSEARESEIPASAHNYKPFYRKNFYLVETNQAANTVIRWLEKNADHLDQLVADEIVLMETSIAQRKHNDMKRWQDLVGNLPRPEDDDTIKVSSIWPNRAQLYAGRIYLDTGNDRIHLSFSLPTHLKTHLKTIVEALNDLHAELTALPAGATTVLCSTTVYDMSDIKLDEPDEGSEEAAKIITIVLPEPED